MTWNEAAIEDEARCLHRYMPNETGGLWDELPETSKDGYREQARVNIERSIERLTEMGGVVLLPASPERTALSRALGLAKALRDYPEGIPTREGGVRDVASEIVTLLEGVVG